MVGSVKSMHILRLVFDGRSLGMASPDEFSAWKLRTVVAMCPICIYPRSILGAQCALVFMYGVEDLMSFLITFF